MQLLKSKIILAKNINVDKNYINVIDYSESNMVNLVLSGSHLVAQKDDYQFLRNNGTIFVDIPYATCLQANYIAFQNKDYSNKWFFAWIDEIIFNSDKNAEIRYTIDHWSTWHDYWTQKPCFVQREHVNDDTIGANTIPENLDIGEVVQDGIEKTDSSLNSYYWLVVECEWDPEKKRNFSGIALMNGQLQAFPYYFIKYSFDSASGYHNLNNFLLCVASGGGATYRDIAQGNIEYIKNIFIVPEAMCSETSLERVDITAPNPPPPFPASDKLYDDFSYYKCPNGIGPIDAESYFFDTNKVHSYTNLPIKNNKCYCYPYNYLLVTNNIGNQNIYKYEDFTYDLCSFKFVGSVTIGGSGKLVPQYYKGIGDNLDESIPLGKYPTFSWSSDAFTNWLTQNAVNIPTSIVGLGGSVTQSATSQIENSKTGELSGSGSIGLGMTIASGVLNTIGAFHSASLLPNIKGGQNTGDVNFSAGFCSFTYHPMRAKDEYMKRIDDYFTRFGYKIDRVKTANLTGRNIFNYVEIGSSESIGYGSLPSQSMETINNAFRRGVTIWHNHANIGNYNLNNSIVSN